MSTLNSPSPLITFGHLSESKKSEDMFYLQKENEMLKEEVFLLHELIKEAVPVFSKITEEMEEESLSRTLVFNETSL